MSSNPSAQSRAIVIGASMAGLLAARALAERFKEVWLLERDVLPQEAAMRKGTPQATHTHGLLGRGREIMEGSFPGLTDTLVAQGAALADIGQKGLFIAQGRHFAQGPCGVYGLGVSRLALEAEVRRRVRGLQGVRFFCAVDVVGLAWSPSRDRVAGVKVRLLDGEPGAAEQCWEAALVVDTSGRASRCPTWLRDAGYEAPPEVRVGEGAGVVYASACFERDPEGPITPVLYAVTPPDPIGAVLLPQETDEQGRARWAVTVGGYGADRPEPTLQGMLAHARRMACPEIIQVIQHARLIGEVKRYQFAYSCRRRYEALPRFPQGLLVMGDAMASFNPIYGQGMTVAACEAHALARLMVHGLDGGFAKRFFKAAAHIVDVPWQIAVNADLAMDVVPGERTLAIRLTNAYVQRVQRAAAVDPVVAGAFIKVAHLMRPPSSLMAPSMMWRVWRGNRMTASVPVPIVRDAQGAI